MIEKALIVVLISLAILATLPRVGCQLDNVFDKVEAGLHPGLTVSHDECKQ